MRGYRKRRVGSIVRTNPLMVIAVGFAVMILIGTALLSLPVASITRRSIGVFDALFTATSSVCVTGLVVRDTGTTFSLFGQVVLLLLIQVGGLGFMTFGTVIYRALGQRLTVNQRMVAQESLNTDSAFDLGGMMRWILVSTLTMELGGAVLLSIRLIPEYGIAKGAFFSVFHAVSAFCNAGFDLFGGGAGLTGHALDPLFNLAAILLVIQGGLGFQVELELLRGIRRRDLRRVSLQTRVVLVTYGVLLLAAFVFDLLAEWDNPGTLGPMTVPQKLLAAFFQSVTLRTAGFNTIDQMALRPATKLFNCLFMFVGAAPASTGGGVKVTTVAVLALLVHAVVSGQSDIVVFRRTLDRTLVQRAVTIILLALAIVMTDIIAISLLQPEWDLIDVAYECFSAMGTVGISSAGTCNLGATSRVLLILTMYMGRIGPITAAILLRRRQSAGEASYRYPVDRFMIG